MDLSKILFFASLVVLGIATYMSFQLIPFLYLTGWTLLIAAIYTDQRDTTNSAEEISRQYKEIYNESNQASS